MICSKLRFALVLGSIAITAALIGCAPGPLRKSAVPKKPMRHSDLPHRLAEWRDDGSVSDAETVHYLQGFAVAR